MTPEQNKLLQQLAPMGDVVHVQEDGSRIVLNEQGRVALETQADAVLYFFQHMDISMLKMVLDDDHTYQDFEKKEFLKKLEYAFTALQEAGNTYLNRYEGFCNSEECNFKCKGYSFGGNVTHDYLDVIVDVRENRVFDLYECEKFKCELDSPLKNTKLVIDDELPF